MYQFKQVIAMVDKNAVRDAENAVRDLKNWIAVFGKEYSLPKSATDKLHEQIDIVAAKVGKIK